MKEAFSQEQVKINQQSSKGNQLKWQDGKMWYKADYTGYEGLSEYLVSELLRFSTLEETEYVMYTTEEIVYKWQHFSGCKSRDFLPEGWQLFTLERLFQSFYNKSLNGSIYAISDVKERIKFLVDEIEMITGLKNFGAYMSKLLTIDALFLNEDRHTHNMAVLRDTNGKYHYCPVFDNGAALLSDTTQDYPLGAPIEELLKEAKAKSFCNSFDEQLEAVESLYGQQIKFSFTEKEVEYLLNQEKHYPVEVKKRVKEIILQQKRKYQYLFWN